MAVTLHVYLDQNIWIGLTAARLGRENGARFAALYETCCHAAESGSASFVLSIANYEENWRRGNFDDRFDVAITMGLLSRFAHIAPVWRIIDWEISTALHAFLDLPGAAPIYDVFGRGANQLLNADLLRLDGFSPAFQYGVRSGEYGIDEQTVLDRLECAAIVGPPGNHSFYGLDRPSRDHQLAYIARREELAENLKSLGNSPDLVNRFVTAAELVDLLPLIEARAQLVGRSVKDLTDRGRDVMEAFLSSMPMESIVRMVHRYSVRDSRAWTVNDYNDVLYLSAASAYCDVVAGEKHWTAKLLTPRVPVRATIVSTPERLDSVLRSAATASS